MKKHDINMLIFLRRQRVKKLVNERVAFFLEPPDVVVDSETPPPPLPDLPSPGGFQPVGADDEVQYG